MMNYNIFSYFSGHCFNKKEKEEEERKEEALLQKFPAENRIFD